MAKLPILRYPDERLHTVAKPIAAIGEAIKQMVTDMLETMYDAGGIGLAATQVDFHYQLVVMDLSQERNQPMVLINPEIVEHSPTCHVSEEGCLSVPDIREKVSRFDTVHVRALDVNGQPFEIFANELEAVCIQHELDHLKGKVFVEYLSPLKLSRIKTKLRKQSKENS